MSLSPKSQIRSSWKENYPRDLSWQREASQRTVAHILASEAFAKAKQIALYSPLPWEIDISSLWQARPNSCAFPAVDSDSLKFFIVPSLLELKPGYAGILEPSKESRIEVIDWHNTDIFLIPGYGFDLTGTRIGSGKGFYDRFFSTLTAKTLKWGVAFQSQVSSQSLPRESHDIPMDALCTEKGITVI